ncbi:exonuclease domain-containing protein [Alloscardovia omnicolens]|uniref:exonuclease domain-containing protein n=1 Tax=Alloscardovia omnicolens TaxID=419015 RepID=UPI003A762D1E
MTSLVDTVNALTAQPRDLALSESYFLGFDTETTGTFYGKDSIVSASLVLRKPGSDFSADVRQEWVINPGMPMHPAATRVNGFTDDFLAENGQEQSSAIRELSDVIVTAQVKNIPLVAYNAPFDIAMLNGDVKKIGLAQLSVLINDRDDDAFLTGNERELLVLDPLVIDRAVSKRRGGRKLIDTTEYYGVYPHGDFHTATADTVATLDVLQEIIRLHSNVASLPLTDIMAFQRSSYNAWKENFNSYLSSQNRPLVQGSWL